MNWRELVCHGRRDRCLRVGHRVMPICARCFGFYTGIGIGFILGSLLVPDVTPTWLFVLTAMAIVPMAIDGFRQELFSHESCNAIRFSTGELAGAMIGLDIWWILVVGT